MSCEDVRNTSDCRALRGLRASDPDRRGVCRQATETRLKASQGVRCVSQCVQTRGLVKPVQTGLQDGLSPLPMARKRLFRTILSGTVRAHLEHDAPTCEYTIENSRIGMRSSEADPCSSGTLFSKFCDCPETQGRADATALSRVVAEHFAKTRNRSQPHRTDACSGITISQGRMSPGSSLLSDVSRTISRGDFSAPAGTKPPTSCPQGTKRKAKVSTPRSSPRRSPAWRWTTHARSAPLARPGGR